MQVQINLNKPFEYTVGQPLEPFKFRGNLVMVTDPGKTNMAMVIGTTYGTQLCILQFRAPGRAYDNSDYCHDFKDFLTRYFAGCTFKYIGIEKAISKEGMNFHHSSMVLTEIRANLIDVAYSLMGAKPEEINNWSWKYAILPEGMRSQKEKGSARFLSSMFELYGNADVTDGICMYRYVIKKHFSGVPEVILPEQQEQPLAPYTVYIVPKGHPMAIKGRRFHYNDVLSLDENCAYYINRTWERGIADVNIESLSLNDIYAHSVGFSKGSDIRQAEVVVVRS